VFKMLEELNVTPHTFLTTKINFTEVYNKTVKYQ